MLRVFGRVRLVVVSVGLLGVLPSARAGGWHHCRYKYTATTGAAVAAPSGMFAISPASVVPASGVALVPSAAYGYSAAAPAFAIPAASAPAFMIPAAGYGLSAAPFALPAASYGYSPAASPFALPAASYGYSPAPASGLASVPASAALSYASSVPASSAAAAESQYPALAQAARSRGFDGGRFVVYLRNLLQRAASQGQGSVLRDIIEVAVRLGLQIDPRIGGIAGEIDRLLREVGGGGNPGTGGLTTNDSGSGCVTIQIRCDGGRTNVTRTDTVGNPAVDGTSISGGAGVPSSSPQSPAAGVETANAQVAPPPAAPDAEEDVQAKRHQEIMQALRDLTEAIKAKP